jgi:NADH-quinone oxidoreductase subunit I
MKGKGSHRGYLGNIIEGISSSLKGLALTLKHLWDARFKRPMIGIEDPDYFNQKTGIVTLEYPHEAIPVPDNGRYRLHNEIDDCIVCDLCAKICPVNCIEIEPVKSTEEIGKTSDGSTKRIYAAKFDIDMAKCCYCGLCTTVCPTECLTMTKTYDYSEFDIRNMVYHFTDLTPEQADEKKKIYEEQQKEKERAKAAATAAKEKSQPADNTVLDKPQDKPAEVKKPVFKPVIKPPVPKKTDDDKDKKE